MWKETLKSDLLQGFKIGLVCGIWIGVVALAKLLEDMDKSLIEFATEMVLIYAAYPALVAIVIVITISNHEGSKLILANSGAIIAYISANLLLQIAFAIYEISNNQIVTFEMTEIVSVSTMINGLLLGMLLALSYEFLGKEVLETPVSDTSENQDLPPKPNLDPRIETLRQEVHVMRQEMNSSKLEIYQLRKEIWQLSSQR